MNELNERVQHAEARATEAGRQALATQQGLALHDHTGLPTSSPLFRQERIHLTWLPPVLDSRHLHGARHNRIPRRSRSVETAFLPAGPRLLGSDTSTTLSLDGATPQFDGDPWRSRTPGAPWPVLPYKPDFAGLNVHGSRPHPNRRVWTPGETPCQTMTGAPLDTNDNPANDPLPSPVARDSPPRRNTTWCRPLPKMEGWCFRPTSDACARSRLSQPSSFSGTGGRGFMCLWVQKAACHFRGGSTPRHFPTTGRAAPCRASADRLQSGSQSSLQQLASTWTRSTRRRRTTFHQGWPWHTDTKLPVLAGPCRPRCHFAWSSGRSVQVATQLPALWNAITRFALAARSDPASRIERSQREWRRRPRAGRRPDKSWWLKHGVHHPPDASWTLASEKLHILDHRVKHRKTIRNTFSPKRSLTPSHLRTTPTLHFLPRAPLSFEAPLPAGFRSATLLSSLVARPGMGENTSIMIPDLSFHCTLGAILHNFWTWTTANSWYQYDGRWCGRRSHLHVRMLMKGFRGTSHSRARASTACPAPVVNSSFKEELGRRGTSTGPRRVALVLDTGYLVRMVRFCTSPWLWPH